MAARPCEGAGGEPLRRLGRLRCGAWALFLAVLWGVGALVAPAWAGSVEAGGFKSRVLGRPWNYSIYLPSGYDAAGEGAQPRYPVLYLLHGNGGDRNEWPVKGRIQQTADTLIAAGEMPPVIIVMPDAGTSWYVDLREKMETAFFEELLPHVEAMYRAQRERDGRVIGGVSMGGYGALRYVLERPEKFRAAMLLSPAVYDPEPPLRSAARSARVFVAPGGDGRFDPEVWKAYNYPALWDAFLRKGLPVPMYIDAGDDDEFMIEGEAARLYERLRRAGQPAELRIVDGRHDWTTWRAATGDALRYVFRAVRRPQPQ